MFLLPDPNKYCLKYMCLFYRQLGLPLRAETGTQTGGSTACVLLFGAQVSRGHHQAL